MTDVSSGGQQQRKQDSNKQSQIKVAPYMSRQWCSRGLEQQWLELKQGVGNCLPCRRLSEMCRQQDDVRRVSWKTAKKCKVRSGKVRE